MHPRVLWTPPGVCLLALALAASSAAGPLSGPAQHRSADTSDTRPGAAATTGDPVPAGTLDDAERLASEAGEQYRQKKFRAAVATATRALEIRQRLLQPDDELVQTSSLNLALVLREAGDLDLALARFTELLPLVERKYGSDSGRTALCLYEFAKVYIYQNHFSAALSLLERSLAIFKVIYADNRAQLGAALFDFASTLKEHGGPAEAREYFARAAAVYQALDDHWEATCLARIADTYKEQDQIGAAIAAYRQALLKEEQFNTSGSFEAVMVRYNLAALLIEQGNLVEGQPLLEATLAAVEKGHGANDPEVASLLVTLGQVEAQRGNIYGALPSLRRALTIYQAAFGSSSQQLADTSSRLAFVYLKLGDPVKSRPLYEHALTVYQAAPVEGEPAATLFALGGALFEQGDYDSAEVYAEKALAEYQKAGGPVERQVETLHLLSIILDAQGRETESTQRFEQATKLMTDAGMAPTSGMLLEQALRSHKKGDLAGARAILEKLLPTTEAQQELGDATYLYALASVLEDQNDLVSAEKARQRALKLNLAGRAADHPHVGAAYDELGRSQQLLGQFGAAEGSFLQAAAIFDKAINEGFSALSFAEQQRFFAQRIEPSVIGLLSAGVETGHIEAIYPYLFHWKGLLIESLRRETLLRAASGSLPQAKDQVDLLLTLRSALADWYYRAPTVSVEAWKTKNANLTRQKEELERALAGQLGPAALHDPVASWTTREIRGLLSGDEALVDIYQFTRLKAGGVRDDRYVAVVLGRVATPRLVDLGSVDEVNRLVKDWRLSVLRNEPATEQWDQLATALWTRRLGPAMPAGVRKIIVSPEAPLCVIPWQLLPGASPRGGAPLLVAQIDSPRELAVLRAAGRRADQGPPEALLIGNIDYSPAAAGPMKAAATWVPLPSTLTEVQSVQRQAEARGIRVRGPLIGREATKPAVLQQLEGASYLFLATHAALSPSQVVAATSSAPSRVVAGRNPLVESGIILAGANSAAGGTDPAGLLSSEELIGRDLRRCRLVTLSACDTGLGENVTAQGLLGFRSAFMAAGARAAIVSLWRVNADASALFTEKLYGYLWGTAPLSNAAALARAQQDVRQQYPKPYDWAGWVLVGDGWPDEQ